MIQHLHNISDGLSRMFPDVNGAVKSGDLSIDAALDAWTGIKSEFNPSPMIVILHGSVLAGYARPYSDIDLVLVSRSGDRIRRRPMASNGYLLDVTLFPLSLVEETAKLAAQKLSPARICGFRSGLPIAGNSELFESIRARVDAIYAKRDAFAKRMTRNLESKLLGILSDLAFIERPDIIRHLIQEASFVALSLISIRTLSEVLPPSILIRKCDLDTAKLIDRMSISANEGKESFMDFILNSLKFSDIDSWGQIAI